jgi:hypothetical protein
MRSDAFKIFRIAAVALAVVSCGGPPRVTPPIMTFPEYAKRDHHAPYIVSLTARNGARLLYYGTTRVSDAAAPAVADIQARWKAFDPSFAFNEGGNPPVAATLAETIGQNGEPALVRWLATRSHVHVESIDPPRADLVKHLQDHFTAEQIKVSLTLEQVAEQQRRADPLRGDDLDEEIARVLDLLGQVPGLDGPPTDLDELRETCARLLPQLADWREVPPAWFDPAIEPPTNWVNELARASNAYRDEFMVQRIVAQLGKGDHIFAVAGVTHVVMQERRLRSRAQHLGEIPGVRR